MRGARSPRSGCANAQLDNAKPVEIVEKKHIAARAPSAQGRPVLVFAAFPSPTDHRYLYARFTGERWVTHEITPAGGSISEDPREPYYSGGITLDHEDPRVVYLSRAVGNADEVETWRTPDGGATWTSAAVAAGSDTKNVRPVSPRGMLPFSGDMSVLCMRGRYP
jgi:hypothetical protein